MILSDVDISREIGYGNLSVQNVDMSEQLQPCSLDVCVGDEYSYYDTATNVIFDTRHSSPESYLRHELIKERDGLLVQPGDFYLVNTEEYISLPSHIEAEVRGRSSLGRLGLEVHSTAGLVDAGFEGELVLEISNNSSNPIRIYPGDRIAQLVFSYLETETGTPYGEKDDEKYQGQVGAVGSRIDEDRR